MVQSWRVIKLRKLAFGNLPGEGYDLDSQHILQLRACPFRQRLDAGLIVGRLRLHHFGFPHRASPQRGHDAAL